MKPTERFSNRAEDYRRYRPGYPREVAELMRNDCGLAAGAKIADVGAGTGIFTRVLLDAGFDVAAVEPNNAMRQAAEQDLSVYPGFHAVAAPAEDTGLPANSFDAVTVAQAFHWFDPDKARREFRRILKRDGWVFIIRNQRLEGETPFASDYEKMLQTLGERYQAAGHRNREAQALTMKEFFPDQGLRIAQFENPHSMDWEGLRGRFLSMSYVPVAGQPGHDELMSRLEEIFKKHEWEGRVSFEQVTEVHYGHLGAEG